MQGTPDALGERFRAAREARGLSLSDVAEQIRIRSLYLAAIEDEDWSAIGAPVYVRGFLRTYARFLGIDPEEAVAAFGRVQPGGAGSPGAAVARARGGRVRRPPARLDSDLGRRRRRRAADRLRGLQRADDASGANRRWRNDRRRRRRPQRRAASPAPASSTVASVAQRRPDAKSRPAPSWEPPVARVRCSRPRRGCG